MGDKLGARARMKALGLPVVPGSDGPVEDDTAALAIAKGVGYPLLIKAAAGGGGKGIRRANNADELLEQIAMARSEARGSFGSDTVYFERLLLRPRHIEIQILADGQGGVVYIGERDCSLQRNRQKILEEAPSPALGASEREELGTLACDAMRAIGYKNAGTLEFLYEDGQFYFLEMNTRLQVEHPVTEMISGIDIVREQIRIAAGVPLDYEQSDIVLSGHAIECRLNAENPVTFAPSPGRVTEYHPAGGLGVRVDSGLYAGYVVPPYYDSLVAKLIVHGRNRTECVLRLRRALEECVIGGVETTIPLHLRLTNAPDFLNGNYDITWLERFVGGAEGSKTP
jgi:acetyl-CoA carboxylase, biotin carboxylase subunit